VVGATLTAISRQSAPSSAYAIPSSDPCATTAVAANRSVVLEGAFFDCELASTNINRAARAQAAPTGPTAISPLYVEALDVNIPEREPADAGTKI